MRFNVSGNTITFISRDEFWNVERDGTKSNTIRRRNSYDILTNGIRLDDGHMYRYDTCIKNISMVNDATGESFDRDLTNVSVYDDIIIFSW